MQPVIKKAAQNTVQVLCIKSPRGRAKKSVIAISPSRIELAPDAPRLGNKVNVFKIR